jgi:hypothetical protein
MNEKRHRDVGDQSALESKGELVLVATADPDKQLRQEPKQNKDKAAAAALLLNNSVQQQGGQYGGRQNAAWWANQLLAGTSR